VMLSTSSLSASNDISTQMGTYNTIKATLAHVRASKGAYIHVSATLHYRGLKPLPLHVPSCFLSIIGTPYQVHVNAAKAAVDAVSATLAVEEGPRGVRSNVIAPGPVGETTGMDRLSPKEGLQLDDLFSSMPLGRWGHVKDIGNAAVFLFSEAAAFINGQIIVVDGGHEHLRTSYVPYPQSVLNPGRMSHIIKSRM
jgi:peroxisomal 2,4-dienoyl-CoA reductase